MNKIPISVLQPVVDLVHANRKYPRTIIAIAGPPASGKSTLAKALVDQLNTEQPGQAALIPMDGFHFDNDELDQWNLRERKGSPQTFDVKALITLVDQLKVTNVDLYYPLFDRAQDKTLPNAGMLSSDTPIVVIEGNYLLLDQSDWKGLAGYFDASVFLSPPLEILEQRLLQRWIMYGFSAEDAYRKASINDLVNAKLILDHSKDADLHLSTAHT